MDKIGDSPLFEHLEKRALKTRTPLHAQIELTHRCNVKCGHCYLRNTRPEPENELSIDELKDVFLQLAEMGTMFLALTGGEPFVRNDIFQIIEEAAKYKFVTNILTNGFLVDRKKAVRLKELNVFQAHVSLLGLEKTHDKIAGVKGAYTKAINAMDYLREVGIRVIAKIIVTNQSVKDTKKMIALAKEHAGAWVLSNNIIPDLEGNYPQGDITLKAENFHHIPVTNNTPELCAPSPDSNSSVCNAARTLLAIDPYGEVFPCVSFRKKMGNVRQSSISQIWNSDGMKQIATFKQSDLKDCANCELKEHCSFCPGISWLQENDFSACSPHLKTTAEFFKAISEIKKDAD